MGINNYINNLMLSSCLQINKKLDNEVLNQLKTENTNLSPRDVRKMKAYISYYKNTNKYEEISGAKDDKYTKSELIADILDVVGTSPKSIKSPRRRLIATSRSEIFDKPKTVHNIPNNSLNKKLVGSIVMPSLNKNNKLNEETNKKDNYAN